MMQAPCTASRRDGYCGYDLVAWSALVDGLGDWRFDGVIFRSEKGADGRKWPRLYALGLSIEEIPHCGGGRKMV